MHLKNISDTTYDQLYGRRGSRYRSSRRHDRFYEDDGFDNRGGGGSSSSSSRNRSSGRDRYRY